MSDPARLCLRTSEASDTRSLAAALAGALACGDIVVLCGELGAGKTTFAQGVAAGLGVREAVTSPTFTLLRPYACASPTATVHTLWHADLYRLERVSDVEELGIDELVEDDAVAVVEWGDVVGPLFGDGRLEVRLERVAAEAQPEAHVEAGADCERAITVQIPVVFSPERRRRLADALRPWTTDRVRGR
jgi:tRNA threonylcarbamoyladenosine biosynthesis protein TsaE